MPYKDKIKQKEHGKQYYLRTKERYKLEYLENIDEIRKRKRNNARKNYWKNPEKNRKYRREYYHKSKDIIKEANKKWVDKNKDKVKKIKATYRERHKEELRRKGREYVRRDDCKVKLNINRKEWRHNNPDKVKEDKLRRRFGISLQDFNSMIENQNGQCGICARKFSTKNNTLGYPCVDHDHLTKKVRGILCRGCNSGIGGFKDIELPPRKRGGFPAQRPLPTHDNASLKARSL